MKCVPCNCGMSFETALSPIEVSGEVLPSQGEKVKVPREQEYGVRNPRKLMDPRLPTQQEVDEHNLTHLPYRSWCPYCVGGKGKMAAHFKQIRADGLPEIHLDYCFMATDGSPLATILVAKEKFSKMSMSSVVPMKGGSVEFPVRRGLAFLKGIGIESTGLV